MNRWTKLAHDGLSALRFAVLARRFDYRSPCVESFDFRKAAHVVLCKFDGKLGDAAVISAFLSALRAQCPQLRISVVCSSAVASLYRDFMPVDRVVVTGKSRPSAREIRETARELEAVGRCGLLIATEPASRFRELYLANLLRPAIYAGLDSRLRSIGINLAQRNPGVHFSGYFADLLRMGGLSPEMPGYVKFFTAEDAEAVAGSLPEGVQELVGLVPFGASSTRKLRTSEIRKAAERIAVLRPEARILLLGLPEEIGSLTPHLEGLPVDAPARALSVREFAAAIDRLSALVSVDTAAVHLAAASSVPVFGIYSGDRPDNPRVLWGPGPFAAQGSFAFAREGVAVSALRAEDFLPDLDRFLALSCKRRACQ